MARKKEFDPEKALDKAMNIFWLKGYDATSVDDLCEAMGIRRGSLYDTFGDKRSLFLKSLDRYAQKNKESAESLEELDSALQAIATVFYSALEEALNDPHCRGCFVVNTITELAAINPVIASFSKDQSAKFEKSFYNLLVRAEKDGEIEVNQDLHAKAQFLVNAFYGLRVTAKVNQNRSALENIVKTTLSVLS
jgi:TetR/AcrR family transcriptional regulator, transcriptional repressor for nem operon